MKINQSRLQASSARIFAKSEVIDNQIQSLNQKGNRLNKQNLCIYQIICFISYYARHQFVQCTCIIFLKKHIPTSRMIVSTSLKWRKITAIQDLNFPLASKKYVIPLRNVPHPYSFLLCKQTCLCFVVPDICMEALYT